VLPKKQTNGRAKKTSITPKTALRLEKYPLCRGSGMRGSVWISAILYHHIYVHADVPELVNLQNVNGQAKPYQVKQLLRLIERYNLQMEEEP
jgi:hypothetical protein